MQIGKINNNISFKRAIVIKNYDTIYNSSGKMPQEIFDICGIINGKKSKVYSDEKSEAIRNFFYQALGDCNSQTPVFAEKSINGDIVLLSGEEAQQIQDFKSKIQKSILRYKTDKKLTYSSRNALINKAITALKTAVEYRIEDGKRYKPDSLIEIESLPTNTTDKKITYTSYKTSFLPAKDGAVDPKSKESRYPYSSSYNYKNASYERLEIIV